MNSSKRAFFQRSRLQRFKTVFLNQWALLSINIIGWKKTHSCYPSLRKKSQRLETEMVRRSRMSGDLQPCLHTPSSALPSQYSWYSYSFGTFTNTLDSWVMTLARSQCRKEPCQNVARTRSLERSSCDIGGRSRAGRPAGTWLTALVWTPSGRAGHEERNQAWVPAFAAPVVHRGSDFLPLPW